MDLNATIWSDIQSHRCVRSDIPHRLNGSLSYVISLENDCVQWNLDKASDVINP